VVGRSTLEGGSTFVEPSGNAQIKVDIWIGTMKIAFAHLQLLGEEFVPYLIPNLILYIVIVCCISLLKVYIFINIYVDSYSLDLDNKAWLWKQFIEGHIQYFISILT